ncbi:MAG: Hsp33 family molecular chaperone HslO [Firmicutes bacterium]|nr:Hsp33 family molecular chaperone HslO [Bacillota bacterium]
MNTIIAVDKSGSYRVYLTVTTEMVRKAIEIHECTPLAGAALGRTMIGAGIMGLMLKDDNARMTLQIKGDGPAQEILAASNGKGEVKAYISNPYLDLPLKGPGKLDVGAAVGAGTLTVIKDLGLKEPYVGRVDLVSGEIAEDLTQYFTVSEQQPSSVALGVRFGINGELESAGGMVIQVLPDASEEALKALEDMLFYMDSLTLLINDARENCAAALGREPNALAICEELLKLIFKDMPAEFYPEILDRRSISWNCDCSRDRMAKALVSIGAKDLKTIIEEDGEAELSCTFCRKKYHFDKAELTELLKYAQQK